MDVPVCLDAERRVLGTMITFYTPQLVERVQATNLAPGDFYYRTHEAVYRGILRLDADQSHIDGLTLGRFLAGQRHPRDGTWLAAVGGQAKLDELAAHGDVNGYVECARIVREDSLWRRWLGAMYTAIDAIETRDDAAFWRAISGVREDAPVSGLRVISGEGKAA